MNARALPSGTALPPAFDGSVLINQRTLRLATRYFRQRRTPSWRPRLTLTEVFELLSLIDLYVVCPRLVLDGTLPRQDLEALVDELAFLKTQGLDIRPITPGTRRAVAEVAGHAAFAAAQAKQSMLSVGAIDGLDQPLDVADRDALEAEVEGLRRRVGAGGGTPPDAVLHEILTRDVRGAKMLAGLAALGHDTVDQVLRSGEDRALRLGMLVNRFRFFYLRQVGFADGTIYTPGERFEGLSRHQALLFYTHLKRLLRARPAELPSSIRAAYGAHGQAAEAPFPPIGLYALFSARPGVGRPLLERATELREEHAELRGFLSRTTRDAVAQHSGGLVPFTNDAALDRLIERMNSTFSEAIRGLEERRRYGAQHGRRRRGTTFAVARYAVPALAGFVAGATATVAVGPAGPVVGAAVAAGLTALATDLGTRLAAEGTESMFGTGLAATTDQYRRLHFALFEDPTIGGDLRQRIEEMLGCELVMPPAGAG